MARPRVSEDYREPPVWLDYARLARQPDLPTIERDQADLESRAAQLRRVVQLWAVVSGAVFDATIYADLAPEDADSPLGSLWTRRVPRPGGPVPPLPRYRSPGWDEALWAAGELTRTINDFLVRHEAAPRYLVIPTSGEIIVRAEFTYRDGVEDAWAVFLDDIRGPREPLGHRACIYCSRAFRPQRDTAQYCSDSCRVQAYKRRKRDAGS